MDKTGEGSVARAASSAGAALVEEARRAVVEVRSGGRGSGAGVIWPGEGLVLTNNHVVAWGRCRGGVRVILHDGRALEAEVVKRSRGLDLALLRLRGETGGLPVAPVGDSDALRVGELVYAIGHPWGNPGTATAGVVSGLGVTGGRSRWGGSSTRYVRSDVALAPGNSGGPLADVEGRVLGINAMISAAGIALAIPAAAVRAFLAPHRPNRPYLGISGLPVTVQAAGTRRGGLLLTAVDEGSPADRAGMLQGDIVVGLDGGDVQGEDEVHRWMGDWQSGRPVQIDVVRGQEPRRFLLAPSIQSA